MHGFWCLVFQLSLSHLAHWLACPFVFVLLTSLETVQLPRAVPCRPSRKADPSGKDKAECPAASNSSRINTSALEGAWPHWMTDTLVCEYIHASRSGSLSWLPGACLEIKSKTDFLLIPLFCDFADTHLSTSPSLEISSSPACKHGD